MLKIGTILGSGIGVLLALCVIIGVVSYTQTRVVNQKVDEITRVREPANAAVNELQKSLMETAFSALGYVSTGDTALFQAFQRNKVHLSSIQLQYDFTARSPKDEETDPGVSQKIEHFLQVANNQILLRDRQAHSMEALLTDLDAIDRLLRGRIQTSITAEDPLAYKRLRAALEMEVNTNAITKSLGNFLITGQVQFESRVQKAVSDFQRYFKLYQNLLLSSEEKHWAAELKRLSDESVDLARTIISTEKRREEELAAFLSINRDLIAVLNNPVQRGTEEKLDEAKQDVLKAGGNANTSIILVLLISVAFGVVAGTVMTRSITRPLQQLATVMNAVAQGDSMHKVELHAIAELRSLGAAFNLMTSRLTHANQELREEIAERKRVEEALRHSEEHFRLSIESVKDFAIFMLDPRGGIASWNVGAERIAGFHASEIIGKPYSLFYTPEDIEGGIPDRNLHKASTEGRVEVESWRIRKDGSRFWANVVITAIRDEAGILRGFSKVIRDITERKNMVEQLRESELRFRTMFEDAPIGIALADGDGRFIQTNPALQDMVGYSEIGLLGKTLAEMMHPRDILAHEPLFNDLREGKPGRSQAELQCRRNDGSMAWVNLNVSGMHTDDSRPPYSIMMMEDITRRKSTEQQMRMLAHTITSMNECVVITDAQNTILSVNPAFLRTYGYAEPEVIGRNADLLRLRRESGQLPASIRANLQAGGWTGELQSTKRNGEAFPVLVSTSVVRDESGAPVALVSISRDITEEKRLQEQLEEAEHQRSAALKRFAVAMQRAQEEERKRISRELHDDLCQRLSGMKFRAEVLEDELRPIDKKVFRRLRGFRQELEKSITEVRRISSNLRPNVLDDFGLVTALKLLCKEFEALHDIRTTFHLGDAAMGDVDPDIEIALFRIAQEALSNIAKHAHASSAAVHLVHRGRSLQLIVEDDGKGFNQQDALRAKGSGHGFGFISMRERSELLGGRFVIDSACDKGTTISATIPVENTDSHEENSDTHR